MPRDVDQIGAARRTLPSVTAAWDMGTILRLESSRLDGCACKLPQRRKEINCIPLHTQASKFQSKCIKLPEYADWCIDNYFDKAAFSGKAESEVEICSKTPV